VYILLAPGCPALARCSTKSVAAVEAAVTQATGVAYRVGFTNAGFPSRWHGKVFMQAWLIATTCGVAPNTRLQRKAACEVVGLASFVWWFESVGGSFARPPTRSPPHLRAQRCARGAAPCRAPSPRSLGSVCGARAACAGARASVGRACQRIASSAHVASTP